MDIHKPKPWHGVREFLKEYVIIVVGVLTALGGEQTVEWLHRRHEIAETREAMRSSLSINAGVAQSIVEEEVCLGRLYDQLEGWADGGPRPKADPGDAGLSTLGTSSWDVAKAGRIAQLPLDEQLAYGRFYAQVGNQIALIERQRNDMERLYRVTAKAALTAADAQALREDLAAMRRLSSAKRANNETMLARVADFKIPPTPIGQRGQNRIAAFCKSVGSTSE